MYTPRKPRPTKIRPQIQPQPTRQRNHLQADDLLHSRRRNLREIWNRSRKRNPAQWTSRLRKNLPNDFDATLHIPRT